MRFFPFLATSILAAMAGLLAPSLALAADATPLTGHWIGGYVCAQGKMALTLDLVGAPDGTITGAFAFAPTQGSGPQAATGSYRLKGKVGESGLLSLDGDSWISQPDGYEMVGMLGFLGFEDLGAIDGFSGEIKSTACGTYEVRRVK